MESKRGLVIFDLDGTLFQGRAATLPAVRRAFQELSLPEPDPGEVQYYIGKNTREFHAWLAAQCAAAQAAQLAAAVDRYELDYVKQTALLYPMVPEALTEIQGFVAQMAICSNGYQGYIEQVLSAHDLQRFFDRIRYPRSGGDSKVLMVRELLAWLDGRPALVVGDRADDVHAAHQNGIVAIAATYGYGSTAELAAADAVAASPSDLPGLVRSLLSTNPKA